jgi:hypothetical protein
MTQTSDARHIAEVITEFKLKGDTLQSFRANASILLTKKEEASIRIFLDATGALGEAESRALEALAKRARRIELPKGAKPSKTVLHRYPART